AVVSLVPVPPAPLVDDPVGPASLVSEASYTLHARKSVTAPIQKRPIERCPGEPRSIARTLARGQAGSHGPWKNRARGATASLIMKYSCAPMWPIEAQPIALAWL